jgi:hypothetical protein
MAIQQTKGNDMATKEKTHRKNDPADATETMTGMADTARKNYEQAIRTGQKFQEEAGQWWTRMLTQTAPVTNWQRNFGQFSAMASNALPLAQQCLEGAMNLLEKSGKNGAELMKKAVDAAQTPTPAESQAKWMEFWTSSMKATQDNIETVTQLNSRAIDSWVDFVQETCRAGEPHAQKAT